MIDAYLKGAMALEQLLDDPMPNTKMYRGTCRRIPVGKLGNGFTASNPRMRTAVRKAAAGES